VKSCFILIAVALTMSMAVAHADSIQFDLKSYDDPQGRFSVDVPQGWSIDKMNSFLLYMKQDFVSFGIMALDDAPNISRASDIVNGVLDNLKSGGNFEDLKIVEEPVLLSTRMNRSAHAVIAFKMNGTSSFLCDIFILAESSGTSKFVMLTFCPTADHDSYRSLFESVAHSITFGRSVSTTTDTSETYRDKTGRFSLRIPRGWTTQHSDGMDLIISKGNASLGLIDLSKKPSSRSLIDYVSILIDSLKDSKTFQGMTIIEHPQMMTGTPYSTAYARITYLDDAKKPYTSHFYVIGDANGKARFALTSHVPTDEQSSYRQVFDDLLDSFSSGNIETSSNPKPRKPETYKPQAPVTYSRTKYLFWVHNETEIMKDGESVHTASGPIEHPCAAADGKFLAYTLEGKKVIVVDTKTGKKITVFGVSGNETVKYQDSGSEYESAKPVGFSADGASVYVLQKKSSMFIGGNKLLRVSIANKAAKTVDVGVADAAISPNGDLLILKPGNVQYVPATGDGWEIKPEYSSLYVNGVGFTWEGKPFYNTSDNVVICGPNGTIKTINLSNIYGRPVITDEEAIWDDGSRIVTNREGALSKIGKLGSNRLPFM